MIPKTVIPASLLFFLLFYSTGLSATIQVPGDFLTIQEAITASFDGDTIVVAPGTYIENIDFSGKEIVVKSQSGPEVTVIHGGSPLDPDHGSVVTFQGGEGVDAVLEGFTITHGAGTVVPALKGTCGGGIFCVNDSSPTIRGNIITLNDAERYGGGLYFDVGEGIAPLVMDNRVSKNMAKTGGAIYGGACSVIILQNTIQENQGETTAGVSCGGDSQVTQNLVCENFGTGYDGVGGISCYGAALVSDNDILDNVGGRAGGVKCGGTSVVSNNRISRNRVFNVGGGGILCQGNSPYIHHNQLCNNRSHINGGGIYGDVTAATIEYNVFTGNQCNDSGGGLFIQNSSPIIRFNLFLRNTAHYYGGAVSSRQCDKVMMEGNVIVENVGLYGGGLRAYQSSVSVVNNIFVRNMANDLGGGIYCWGDDLLLLNNTIYDNRAVHGGGLYLESNSTENINSIFWANQARVGPEAELVYSDFTTSRSNLQGGQASVFVGYQSTLNWGVGMIDSDPLFIDPGSDDFHLRYDSPCRNTGDSGAAGLPAIDFEGDPRTAYGLVDIGADEFHPHLYFTGHAEPGKIITFKWVGLPGASPVYLWQGSGVLDPPAPTPLGDWFLKFPITYLGGTAVLPPEGFAALVKRIPAGLPVPVDLPLQAQVGGRLTNLCIVHIE